MTKSTATKVKEFFKNVHTAELISCLTSVRTTNEDPETRDISMDMQCEVFRSTPQNRRTVSITGGQYAATFMVVSIVGEDIAPTYTFNYQPDEQASDAIHPEGIEVETYKVSKDTMLIWLHDTNPHPDGMPIDYHLWLIVRHPQIVELPTDFYTIKNIYMQSPDLIEIEYKDITKAKKSGWFILDRLLWKELSNNIDNSTSYTTRTNTAEISQEVSRQSIPDTLQEELQDELDMQELEEENEKLRMELLGENIN